MPSLTHLPGVTVTGHGQGTLLEFLPAWWTIVPETEVRRVDEAEGCSRLIWMYCRIGDKKSP